MQVSRKKHGIASALMDFSNLYINFMRRDVRRQREEIKRGQKKKKEAKKKKEKRKKETKKGRQGRARRGKDDATGNKIFIICSTATENQDT